MKSFNKPPVGFSLALFCASLAGCVSPHPVTSLSNGYEEVTYPARASAGQPETMRISFQYRAPDGKIASIWPSLSGVDEVIKGDMAIFVGDKAYISSNPEDPRGTVPRLFAVQAPALPLDITDEILWRWSRATGKNFEKTVQLFSMVTPEEKNGQLELQLEFWTQERDWPDTTTLRLSWNQLSEIMREVKAHGTMHKDLRWGTRYIAK